MVTLTVKKLTDFVSDIFVRAKSSKEEAQRIAH